MEILKEEKELFRLLKDDSLGDNIEELEEDDLAFDTEDNILLTGISYPKKILKVKHFEQENGYYCGFATVKQTLHYLTGKSPTQKSIARVKFEQTGNWRYPIAGHFLNVSGYTDNIKKVHLTDPYITIADKTNKTGKYYVTFKELFGYMPENKEYNCLLEVDLENFTAQLIPIEDANAPFVNIAVTDQDVFLLKRDENGEDCTYTIERLSGKKFAEVAQKTWLGEEGELFLNIYGENGLLYTDCGTSSAEDYFLCMT